MLRIVSKNAPNLKPDAIIKHWPDHVPLLFLGAKSTRYLIFVLKGSQVPWQSFLQKNIGRDSLNPAEISPFPFSSGFIGFHAYDRNDGQVVACKRLLIVDQLKKVIHITARSFQIDGDDLSWDLDDKSLDILCQKACLQKTDIPLVGAIALKNQDSDQEYLANCKNAQRMIEDGRFYQINLLRYFELLPSSDLKRQLALKVWQKGGRYASVWQKPEFALFSFSPEKFLSAFWQRGHMVARASPIKGTVARSGNTEQDEKALAWLLASQKNEAELNMITELMRNDLGEIATLGSVKVRKAKKAFAFASVYHLQSEISSILRKPLTFQEFFAKLCPAASITGAPKKEVEKAIFEFEKRERGFFMGNCFFWDPWQVKFNSSVLIRTVLSKKNHPSKFEFACGSGIVLASSPEEELREIEAKTRILT